MHLASHSLVFTAFGGVEIRFAIPYRAFSAVKES
jgi:hypothetical protein